ncbi:hypothetical protein [Streptomyces sp. NPDC051561]|uniref:hypothetical protein n=1 Tax=Streptomyces sp. NPDC051561 TaxID=3365658 RepID=UPI0037A4CCAF
MSKRTMSFGLYADEDGLAWVEGVVRGAVLPRSARIVRLYVTDTFRGSGMSAAEGYDLLAEQWAIENPGQDSGARQSVELRLELDCSLKNWRSVRNAVIRGLCPEGMAAHTCRVPWMA